MFVKTRPWLRFFSKPGETGGSGSEKPAEDKKNKDGGSADDDADSGNSDDDGSDAGAGESDAEALKTRIAELEKERDTWKGHARTWEERAKKSKNDDGDSSEDFEQRLSELEATLKAKDEELQASRKAELVTRVAAEFALSDEDREFLPDSDNEELLRKHAERLATPKPRGSAEAPNQGRGRGGSSRDAIIERAKNLP